LTSKWCYENLDDTFFKSGFYKGVFVEDRLVVKIMKQGTLFHAWKNDPPQESVGDFRSEKAARAAALKAAGITLQERV
jgi:hypothetical protein